jgi:hypothetical protein
VPIYFLTTKLSNENEEVEWKEGLNAECTEVDGDEDACATDKCLLSCHVLENEGDCTCPYCAEAGYPMEDGDY